MTSPTVFLSYSHADDAWKNRLQIHLAVLQVAGQLEVWEDRRIRAGDDWLPEIEKGLREASVAVLLISPSFLTSSFILDQEVPALLDRRARDGLVVIPLILKPCPWMKVSWLSKIQCRPVDGKALSGFSEHDAEEALSALAVEIADRLEEARAKATSSEIAEERQPSGDASEAATPPVATEAPASERVERPRAEAPAVEPQPVRGSERRSPASTQPRSSGPRSARGSRAGPLTARLRAPGSSLRSGTAKESRDKVSSNTLSELKRALGPSRSLRSLGLLAWGLDRFRISDTDLVHAAEYALRKNFFRPPPLRLPADLWVEVPAGTFEMGSPVGDGHPDEEPRREVTLSAFSLLRHPVTNEEYRRLVPEHAAEEDGRLPAVGVSWFEAYAYAAWLGGRLPTEAEWEFTCRAGRSDRFWSGEASGSLDHAGWTLGNSEGLRRPVEEKAPNPWGLYDVHGNVWEWVQDWKAPYPEGAAQNPWGPIGGKSRVLRGGSFDDPADRARCAYRHHRYPEYRGPSFGFRVLLPTKP